MWKWCSHIFMAIAVYQYVEPKPVQYITETVIKWREKDCVKIDWDKLKCPVCPETEACPPSPECERCEHDSCFYDD